MLPFTIAIINILFLGLYNSCQTVFGTAPDFLLDVANYPLRFLPAPPCRLDWDGRCKIWPMYLGVVEMDLVSAATPLSWYHMLISSFVDRAALK